MDPSTFEMIIILKKNRRFFDAMTINAIIARLASEKQVAKRQRLEALLTRDNVVVGNDVAVQNSDESDSDV
jgi:hypothetical protein